MWEQTFFRNLIGIFVASFILIKNHQPLFGERKYWPQMFARSLFGLLAVMLLFYASRNALQADVSIMNRISMFTISIVSVVFLHERLTKMHIPAMLIAFTGAYIAANPRFDSAFLPLLAAFCTSLCDAVCYPLLSYFSGRVNAYSVVMFFCTFSTIVSGSWHDPDLRRAERSGSVLPHHDRRHGGARPDPDDAVLPLCPRR